MTVEDAEPRPAPGRTRGTLAELYAAQYLPMVRLGYLLTGSTAVAEDLVQDSFVQLQRNWAGVREPTAYLRRSVVNACNTHHRRVGRERERFPGLVRDTVVAEDTDTLDALAALPHRQRAALVLRYYEDRTDAEIAEVLGCRPATVRSLVHRGLATLRKVIT
ncbi:MAG TPA: sigma-70 family RNA polymerase sigma factor [Acidimicrobiia bacterium]|nr:sigma-70 family RNA polymerase sigma factor [Acidimicrobiia bacterium]